ICEIEHSRRRSAVNFLINLFAGLAAYSFFEKKPAIKFERSPPSGQFELFY
ncbi:MAG: IS982 family transposase, partial [Bacteroidales bacterium]|nr:IS982 family transposase [Bacteroidales bacterium]